MEIYKTNEISHNNIYENMITSKELTLLVCICVLILFSGFYLWNIIWVKEYGVNIPNVQYGSEEMTTYFHTKNFIIFLKEFLKKFTEFDKKYLIRSIGTDAYIYLIFQKTIINLLMIIGVNNKYMDNFSSFLHLIGVIIYTFLHFRFFSVLKREAKNIYFEKFDLLSRKKDYNWLSSRTLHISGLAPNERNSKNSLYKYY